MEKLVDKLKNILEKNYFKKDEHGSYFLVNLAKKPPYFNREMNSLLF